MPRYLTGIAPIQASPHSGADGRVGKPTPPDPGIASGASRGRLGQHLVHAVAQPREAVCLDRLGEPGLGDQDVVPPARYALQAVAPDLAQLPLDPVPRDGVPGSLRHRQPEPGVALALVPSEPVENEEARRGGPALAVDGIEVPRARQTVTALHDLQPTAGCVD